MGADKILENFEDLDALGEQHRQEIIDTTKEELLTALKENLRPEFLNRIDEIVMFLPLSQAEIKQILLILLKKVDTLLQRQGMRLLLSEAALEALGDAGYDPQFGARPMKRALQDMVVDELSKYVISGEFSAGDTIYGEAGNDGELVFSKEPPKGWKVSGSSEKPAEEKPVEKKPVEKKPEAEKKESEEERQKRFEELDKAAKDVEEAVKGLKK